MEANDGGPWGRKAPLNGVSAETRRTLRLRHDNNINTNNSQRYVTDSASMAVSIFQRKRDLIYLVFFIVHLPVMLGGSVNMNVWFGSLSQ